MSRSQRLAKLTKAIQTLKRTTRGYNEAGKYWNESVLLLDQVRDDFLATGDTENTRTMTASIKTLKKTTRGYNPEGVYWRSAMKSLQEVRRDLTVPEIIVPRLGPIVAGGASVLVHSLTHMTDGMTGDKRNKYPAYDDGWATGRAVVAPESLTVTDQSGAAGADAFYATGASGIKYWVGHIDVAPANGRKFVKGQLMCRIAWIAPSQGGPHVHIGIDARALTGGKVLAHHTNYTEGAEKVGVQLARALAA